MHVKMIKNGNHGYQSFSVNITNIALEIAIKKNIPIEIVDPDPIEIQYPKIEYYKMNASEYCNK